MKYQSEAILWDGYTQLHGKLIINDNNLIFYLSHFKDSQLHWTIELHSIVSIDSVLIYNLLRNGVKIQTTNNNQYLFVLPDSLSFQQKLKEIISRI